MSYRQENIYRNTEIIDILKSIKSIPSIKLNTEFLEQELPVNPDHQMVVELENKTTISSVLDQVKEHKSITILNMANAWKIGGGWLNGAEAQEEYLFRRTDLSNTLLPSLYPMLDDEIIYSPQICVIRDDNYNNLPEMIKIKCISVAAIKDPRIVHGELDIDDYLETYLKIKMIFHVAALAKSDCLILSALGCGAFHNPPEIIASIFAEHTSEYAGYFKKIVFAIKSIQDVNCEIFQQVFLDKFQIST